MRKEYQPRRLPLIREYPGYQFYARLEYQGESAENCFVFAALCILEWLGKRVHDSSLLPYEVRSLSGRNEFRQAAMADLKSFQINSGFSAGVVSLPSQGIWAMRLKEADSATADRSAVAGRFFITNIGLHLFDGKSVELGIRIDVLDPEGAEEVPYAFRPAFVRDLFEAEEVNISHGFSLIYDKAIRITTEQDWKELAKVLNSSELQMPVILFTEAVQIPDMAALKDGLLSNSFAGFSRSMPLMKQEPVRPSKPKTYFPYSPDDFASHAFGYSVAVSVTEELRDIVTRKLKAEYNPGDILLIEPKRYGGKIRTYGSGDKECVSRVQLISRMYSKNKSYSFGDIQFEYDARNIEHREMIQAIRDSKEIENEEKILRLNEIISELQDENEKRVRKINELKEQNKEEFRRGEAAEQQRMSQLAEDYDQKSASLSKAQLRIGQLEMENAEARSVKAALEMFRSMDELPRDNAAVIQYFQTVFGDRLAFTERGIKTGRKSAIKPEGLWNYLFHMANELYVLHRNNAADVEAQFRNLTGIEVAMGEGNQSRKDSTVMKSRLDIYNGREIWVEPHVKLVTSKAGAEYQRIYYCYDHESERIIISWIGDHLNNAGTRQIS